MARTKGPTHNYYSTPQSIKRFIDQTVDYVKVAPVDQERSIYLISTAKGDCNFRDFAAAAGTSAPSISRIFKGSTLCLGHEIIAGFAAAAEASGAFDLDMLMEAQGWVKKDLIDDFWAKEHRIIRQIITDELLSSGCIIESKVHGRESKFSVQLKESDENGIFWSFTSLLYPLEKKSDLAIANACKWLEWIKAVDNTSRQSLIIDNDVIFRKIVRNFSKRKIDQSLSVILVSIQQRRVVDEFIIPAEDGAGIQRIMSPLRIFEPLKSKPTRKMPTNNPETIIPQLRCDDCRRIIADALLRKDFQIQYEGRNSIISPFIQIDPDVVMEIRARGGNASRWVFNIKSFPKKTNNLEALQNIGNWLTKAMAYYFQGGYMNRFLLVLDDQNIFDAVVDMLRHVTISGEISIVLISPEKNKILNEFIIPQKFSRNDLIRLV